MKQDLKFLAIAVLFYLFGVTSGVLLERTVINPPETSIASTSE